MSRSRQRAGEAEGDGYDRAHLEGGLARMREQVQLASSSAALVIAWDGMAWYGISWHGMASRRSRHDEQILQVGERPAYVRG